MRSIIYGVILLLGLLASVAWAQTRPAAAADTVGARAAQITAGLAGSAEAREQAVKDMHRMLETDPGRAVAYLRSGWMKALLAAGQYQSVDQLAVQGIRAVAQDTGGVEYLLGCRISALRSLGKPMDSLANAKALYNVAHMGTTANAMLTLTQCLNAAYPQDPGMAQRFKDQQMAGARTDGPTTRAADDVLAGIILDGADWRATLPALIGEDFTTLTARGNLLLLCDRPGDARVLFERAYALATDQQIPTAAESLARCMKAQDGSIGRANAWVLSIRPAKKG